MPFPGEPSVDVADSNDLLAGYLRFGETTITAKINSLDRDELTRSVVPSGWSLLGMVKHIACVERYWISHVFLGEDVDFSWPGSPDQEWRITVNDTSESIVSFFHLQRQRTIDLIGRTRLDALSRRTAGDAGRPTFGWIVFHLLQESARHAGHLDIGRELTDGQVEPG